MYLNLNVHVTATQRAIHLPTNFQLQVGSICVLIKAHFLFSRDEVANVNLTEAATTNREAKSDRSTFKN